MNDAACTCLHQPGLERMLARNPAMPRVVPLKGGAATIGNRHGGGPFSARTPWSSSLAVAANSRAAGTSTPVA